MTAAGSDERRASTLDTWPFWAPSHAAAVAEALDLAGVGAGTRICDLGCGDGQVLLAAAERGAAVAGIEADPDLVDEARTNLKDAGVDADIRLGDLFDPEIVLAADVFFAYLAPATLQRLTPTLARHRNTPLVTVDFDVPGLVPTRRGDAARLYRLPGRARPVPSAGWPSAGSLVAAEPGCQSLSCLDAVHPGGASGVRLSDEFDAVGSVLGGADALDAPAHLAIDLRWEPVRAGTVVRGTLHVAGLSDHPLFFVGTDEDDGIWELSAEQVDALDRSLQRGDAPTTLHALLEATAV